MQYQPHPEDRAERAQEANDAHYRQVEEQLRETFRKALAAGEGQIPTGRIYFGSARLQITESIIETVADFVDYDQVFPFLMTVLSKSECPHVEALRKALEDKLVYLRADLLAEADQA